MELQAYIDEIKLELTGGVLDLEIPDTTIGLIVNKALREVQRYIDSTKLMTVPYANCIDISNTDINAVANVYRAEGYLSDAKDSNEGISNVDPMQAMQWQLLAGAGNMYNLNDWVMNYASWNTMLQIRNTTTTDMSYKEDKQGHKLYINSAYDKPKFVTIEYIPVFKNVEDVKDEYWIDIILKLAKALTKIVLGRIRSKYTQSNALWSLDGATLLEEGNQEYNNVQEILRTNSSLINPID